MTCGLVTRFWLDSIRKRRGGLECETAGSTSRKILSVLSKCNLNSFKQVLDNPAKI